MITERKRLFLCVGDEVSHLRYEEWGIGVVMEVMTSSVPGGTCLARVRFQDGQLRCFNNDLDNEACCYYFGVRRYWNPSRGVADIRSKFFIEDRSMRRSRRAKFSVVVLAIFLSTLSVHEIRAEDSIETAGVGIGVTAGNMWFLPLKAISVSMGLFSGAVSFIVTGGDTEVTKQIWHNTTQEPYIITPELAKKSIGQRPELLENK